MTIRERTLPLECVQRVDRGPQKVSFLFIRLTCSILRINSVIKSLEVRNFTAFSEARLCFAEGLNVIVGENGTGKTHLLKLPYAVTAVSAEERRRHGDDRQPTKSLLQTRVAEKIVNVFRPEESRLGRLVRRQQGRNRCEVQVNFRRRETSVGFSFASQSKSEVVMDPLPSKWVGSMPVFLPPRELLTIYPGFISLYETHNVEFEETWRDTCLLLGSPTVRGPRGKVFTSMLEALEEQVGQVALERNGRFYLKQSGLGAGTMEMHLVAEGWRKLAMLARLITTGALLRPRCPVLGRARVQPQSEADSRSREGDSPYLWCRGAGVCCNAQPLPPQRV